jgi:hypothetical protein
MQRSDQPTPLNIPAFQDQVRKAIEVILFTESLNSEHVRPYSSGFETSQQEAEEYVAKASIKQLICQVLRPVQLLANDVFEIAKQVTPVLAAAVVAGTLTIPLDPWLFAWIAVLIYRAGVNTFCADPSTQGKP